MDKIIFNVLDSIEKQNYKAYLVGGFVRDYIYGRNTFDVDICTNAPSYVLINIFKDYDPKIFKYDSVKFTIECFHFDISRIRKEDYLNNKTSVSFTDDLYEDYLRRDFTLNSLYMNKNNVIMGFEDSYNDCVSRTIRFIGNSKEKISEDFSRLFRLVYFSVRYELNIKCFDFDLKKFKKDVLSHKNSEIIKLYLKKISKLEKKDILDNYLCLIGIKKIYERLVLVYL